MPLHTGRFVRFPARERDFFTFLKVQAGSVAQPTSISSRT